MFQLEAEKKSQNREEIAAKRISQVIHSSDEKCFRCNRYGHYAKDCFLKKTNKWFCYCCQGIRTHKGTECPNAPKSKKNNSKRKFKNKSTKEEKNGVNKKYKKNNNHKSSQDGETKSSYKNQETKDKSVDSYQSKEIIELIADSGATDHIVNKSLILTDFEKSENELTVQIKMILHI